MADGLLGVVPTVIGGAVALKFLDIALPDKKGKSKFGGRNMKTSKMTMTRGTLTMPKMDFGSKTISKPKFNMHATLKGKKTKFKSVLASAGV